MAMTEGFDFDWRFARGDGPERAARNYPDGDWEAVDLPHDWSIEGPFSEDNPACGSGAWAPTGVAWYRKSFVAPEPRPRLARLEFDGVYRRASVYLNGELLGGHDYGFSSFVVELGGRLVRGATNVVAVRVDNSDAPNCRWYSGSGIYRRARIAYHGELRIGHYGLSATTPRASARRALVRVAIEARDGREAPAPFEAELAIIAPDGSEAARATRRLEALPGGAASGVFEATVPRPELWSPGTPALYRIEARLLDGGVEADRAVASFGIRKAEFRPGRGFFLNGVGTKLKGVCLHGDGGAVGTAVPAAVWRRRLGLLKEIGCNAIRCAHNPPDPQFLDLCDELGFLVVDEIFDKWEGSFSKPGDWYMRQPGFADAWKETLETSMRRDRNHPSVIMWSVGNETGQPGTDEVDPWLWRLSDAARALDPTRPVTAAFVSPAVPDPAEGARRIMRSAENVDVLCVNYQEPMYGRYHALDPRKAIIGSESFVHWRGIESSIHAFGLRNPWYDAAENDYVAGAFLWPGIDYLGESGSWPLKGWEAGIIDTTGRLKSGGQFHRSAWSDEPMVALAVRDHGLGRGESALSWGGYSLSAHWNWPEFELRKRWPEAGGRLVEIEVQTNCETVEVFLNGLSYGEKRSADFVNSAVIYLVPYQPGVLRAVGRRGGREAAADELRTAGPAAALRLMADRDSIRADGHDAAHVGIELVDAEGRVVPREDRLLRVSVSGPARLLGLDDGRLDSEEGYAGGLRSSGGGYCLAILGKARRAGAIELVARAEEGGLEGRVSLCAE